MVSKSVATVKFGYVVVLLISLFLTIYAKSLTRGFLTATTTKAFSPGSLGDFSSAFGVASQVPTLPFTKLLRGTGRPLFNGTAQLHVLALAEH